MTGIGENTLAQPVKPPLRERRACLAKLVKNRLTLTARRIAGGGGGAGGAGGADLSVYDGFLKGAVADGS